MGSLAIIKAVTGTALFLLLLVGCARDEPSPPSCLSTGEKIVGRSAQGLTEKAAPEGGVAALGFSPDGKVLSIMYVRATGGTGELVRLNSQTLEVERAILLSPASADLTRLSADASVLASAVPAKCPSEGPPWYTRCSSVRVWDAVTGTQLSSSDRPLAELNDMALSPDGDWLFLARPLPEVQSVKDPRVGGVFGIGIEDQVLDFTTGALGARGKTLVFGMQSTKPSSGIVTGLIGMRDWNGEAIVEHPLPDLGPLKSSFGEDTLPEPPLRVALDPFEDWIGILTKSGFSLRQVKSLIFAWYSEHVELPTASAGAIVFSPSGKVVAVGHESGIRVMQVPGLATILDRRGNQVLAIAFSPDGCRLAWGDAEGTVHLMDSPKP